MVDAQMDGEEGGEGEDGEEDEYSAEGEDGEEDKESGDSSAEEDEPIQGWSQYRTESSGGSAAQMTKRRAGLRPWLKITEGLT